MLLGNTNIACKRHFETTAHGIAVDSRNAHSLIGAQYLKCFAKSRGKIRSLSHITMMEALQVSARERVDEVLMELAGVEGVDAVYFTSMVFQ